MKSLSVLLLTLATSNAFAVQTNVDWSQPPLLCVEDVIPAVPTKPCPDMSGMQNPFKDDPPVSASELVWWKNQKFALGYCRSVEAFRREKENPGSQTAGALEISWMRLNAVKDHDLKVKAVYDSAAASNVPPHILTGALMQESIFAPLGVSDDGGNFSCGLGQINLTEWCNWAEAQSDVRKNSMGWPTGGVSCSDEANKAFIKPFYDIAVARLNGTKIYKMEAKHLQNISLKDVSSQWADASSAQQKRRFQVSTSFLNNCMNPETAIAAKAFQLRLLYNNYVPSGLKQHEVYSAGESFGKQCNRKLGTKVYPVQTAWLLAVGAYNAGTKVQDAMADSRNWSRADIADKSTFKNFGPQDLIESIFKVGKVNSATGKVEFKDLDGNTTAWKPFKVCVLQRHIARIVQHVTQPNIEPLVQSLEGAAGCPQ